MRTSRFLTRLARHHSSALTSLSPPATSLLRCSLLSEFCGTSATDDRPSFQFHSNTLLRHGGRGGGFFTSPFPYRGLVSRYCSSRRAISLASFSFDSFNRSTLFLCINRFVSVFMWTSVFDIVLCFCRFFHQS